MSETTVVNNGVNVEALLGAREALSEAPKQQNFYGVRVVNGKTALIAKHQSKDILGLAQSRCIKKLFP